MTSSVMEQFLNTVRAHTSNGSLRELVDYCSKSEELIQKNVSQVDTVLASLDFQQHTIPVVHLLLAKYEYTPLAEDSRLTQMREFISECNGEHIRLVPGVFADLCHHFTKYLIAIKQPMLGISYLRKAIYKLRLNDSQLTSIHADVCQLCLVAKCMKPALEFLDVDITNICVEVTSPTCGSVFDAKYFLLYYYYGGMIYLSLKNLDRALYFFEVAITTPAHAVSHIMLESYKKYILVSLLLYGREQPIPKYASHVVTRFMKPLSQAYISLAAAFEMNNSSELRNVIAKNSEIFTRDFNMGLIKQVKQMLYKKNIQRLTKTFLTLSLFDVANRVGLSGIQEAEQYVLQMIEEKQIYATINQKDGMVVFLDKPEILGGPEVLKELEEELAVCMELNKQILSMDSEIQVNPQYVRKSTGVQDEDQPSKSTYAM
ncbi:COP9 signalosome complex subunit 3 [Coccinella septempunctata]|uniref:COP9 signalosome complex subunit 3 n=1 Tax=Coccinella septempunctata TaxID=41139 RepID=UPI001D066EB4|nr:COP9 signalosome complex subunit 3 [Coccinella septempunctata]